MANRETYEQQVALLVRILPILATEKMFALKGGTAINLFVRDFPRLSVDLDLTYIPVQSREESIKGIDTGLNTIINGIKNTIAGAKVNVQRSAEGHVERLHVQAGVTIKIEVTPVLRGVVYEPKLMTVTDAVEQKYGFAETWVVSQADLYAGKIIAALDRQHPRDLYDVKLLLENEGVSDELRRAFIAYLLSSRRALNAVLKPQRHDLSQKYEQEFVGMAAKDVPLEALLEIREKLIDIMVANMPDDHRRFLLSFKRGEPDWDLLGLPHVAELPAVKFRVQNLEGLGVERREQELQKLKDVLYPGDARDSNPEDHPASRLE
ncbi:nucleotidyl transferase AbiEii/AbiGii toxin family protein [Caulobacter segnis]|uniref:nucleotidyl transferase AbiEii/AbiGii toxin family protein n=1 Tax=Caulobacter segnis TaxID=88688 RepID=UPI00240EC8CE|nr:nucleotidyl transferase AbiEii/AbiGii toxin family protein [Caulobacter segnis]MDG2520600.1 nucleotidyl transferase AbiEii/AbiGii toxin family protein [Caulobacter segnis]